MTSVPFVTGFLFILLLAPLRAGAQLSDPIPEAVAPSEFVVDLVDVATVPPSGGFPLTARLTMMKPVRGDSERLFVGDLRGFLYVVRGSSVTSYLGGKLNDLPNFIDVPSSGTGFGGFAFHPDFLSNGRFYTGHTEATGSGTADFTPPNPVDDIRLQWVVTEWTANDPNALVFEGSRRELLRFDYHGTAHGMQELAFNPTAQPGEADYGMLYIALGEGAPLARFHLEHPGNVQTNTSFLGTIFRIDPSGRDSQNGRYGIPPDNPFAGSEDPAVVREIWTYGHRNPHRLSWDRGGTHKMLIGDIGQSYIEEVNLGLPGANYGWPVREGTFVLDAGADVVYPLPENDASLGFTYPVAQYDHDEGTSEGRAAIAGGYVYRGTVADDLIGQYIFGDIVTGKVYHVPVDQLVMGSQATIQELTLRYNGAETTLLDLVNHTRADLRFGTDNNGEIYVLSKVTGTIWRITGTSEPSDEEEEGEGGEEGGEGEEGEEGEEGGEEGEEGEEDGEGGEEGEEGEEGGEESEGEEGEGGEEGGEGEGGEESEGEGTGTAAEAELPSQAVALYPNPGSGAFVLHLDLTPGPDTRLVVYDLLGRPVLIRPVPSRTLRFNLSDQPAGVYFVRVTHATGVRTLRLVKR